uniref:Orotidine 5'-phosphate decarboxylase n=1 Tax=Cyanothece sp. (strain PCC 7425 / ATCC 29141) TaxID=395961 RepID=B8HTC6_CYAP4
MDTSAHLSTKKIEVSDRLIFALDYGDPEAAREMVKRLGDAVSFYKLGLELFMAGGYFELLNWLVDQGKKVFVDLKFFDVPQTVASAVKALRNKGATFATVHGNDSILAAAAQEKGDLKILAVTVLTSLDQKDLEDLGFTCDLKRLVLSRAKRSLQLGCDGVISSGLEAPELRQELGDRFLIVAPGIRPLENNVVNRDDQKRIVDVRTAFLNGADYIVMGRPIKQAADPYLAAQQVQTQIKAVFGE